MAAYRMEARAESQTIMTPLVPWDHHHPAFPLAMALALHPSSIPCERKPPINNEHTTPAMRPCPPVCCPTAAPTQAATQARGEACCCTSARGQPPAMT